LRGHFEAEEKDGKGEEGEGKGIEGTGETPQK